MYSTVHLPRTDTVLRGEEGFEQLGEVSRCTPFVLEVPPSSVQSLHRPSIDTVQHSTDPVRGHQKIRHSDSWSRSDCTEYLVTFTWLASYSPALHPLVSDP